MLRYKDLPAKAADTFYTARYNAGSGMRSLYSTAMNHPKTASAVILGAGLAAALIWAVRRNGGFRKLQQETLARVREGYGTARETIKERTARLRSQRQEELAQ